MRSLCCLLVLIAAAAAQDATRTLKDDVLTDPFWNFTFKAPGLKEAPYVIGGQNVLFEGTSGDLKVQILVYEVTEQWDSEAWKDRLDAAWKQDGRKLEEVEDTDDPPPHILYVHESLAGFRRHHGHAWFARGYRCFEVHAEANAKTDASAAAIRKVLTGLALGEERNNSLAQAILAKRDGKSVDDPQVILGAAVAYVQQRLFPIAVPLFERAAALIPAGHYDEAQQYGIHEMGGLAILSPPLRDAERALPWHTRAEEIARKTEGMKESAGVSAYNAACAHAMLGKLDEGFAALRRAFAYKSDVVSPEHLAADTDLDNLRNDARWKAFLAEREPAPAAPPESGSTPPGGPPEPGK